MITANMDHSSISQLMMEELEFMTHLATQIHDLDHEAVRNDLDSLRPGRQYSLAILGAEEGAEVEGAQGGINIHYKITFDDGVCWILRVRRDGRQMKHDAMPTFYRPDVEREANTLCAMKRHGMQTVPNAYLPSEYSIATPKFPTAHLYLDYMVGSAWANDYCPLHENIVDNQTARRYMESYADHQIALAGLSFGSIGQLTDKRGKNFVVGPMYGFPMQRDSRALGPFTTLLDRLMAFSDTGLASFSDRDWSLAAPWVNSSPLHPYLALLDRKRLFQMFSIFGEKRTDHFLKHADDKPDQYFAMDGKLSAVLDWEGAYTTTKEEAFMAPCAFWTLDASRISTSLSRDEELLIEVYMEKGREDLADCVRQGLVYRLLDPRCWTDASLAMIQHFRRTFGGGIHEITIPETVSAWEAECLDLFKDDPGLPAILARHRYCQEKRAAEETPSWVKGVGDMDIGFPQECGVPPAPGVVSP